jgi:hypothetical protein
MQKQINKDANNNLVFMRPHMNVWTALREIRDPILVMTFLIAFLECVKWCHIKCTRSWFSNLGFDLWTLFRLDFNSQERHCLPLPVNRSIRSCVGEHNRSPCSLLPAAHSNDALFPVMWSCYCRFLYSCGMGDQMLKQRMCRKLARERQRTLLRASCNQKLYATPSCVSQISCNLILQSASSPLHSPRPYDQRKLHCRHFINSCRTMVVAYVAKQSSFYYCVSRFVAENPILDHLELRCPGCYCMMLKHLKIGNIRLIPTQFPIHPANFAY